MTELQKMIESARNIVFLTGAGVSTPSGIPDYRSKSGLYTQKANPEYLLSRTCLEQEPKKFYHFVSEHMYYPSAEPNVIHKKIAAASHICQAKVITQNVDGLHLSAGTENLVEFHGNLYQVYCQKCGKQVDYREYLKNMIHYGCGGILRPNIVLYEETIAQAVLHAAITMVRQADLLIICGTSLRVYPFAGLIRYRSSAAKIIAINREKIELPSGGSMILEDAVHAFEKLHI